MLPLQKSWLTEGGESFLRWGKGGRKGGVAFCVFLEHRLVAFRGEGVARCTAFSWLSEMTEKQRIKESGEGR